jgi:hypothetical protein
MTIQEIYEQVLLDIPSIPMRNFIKRYNEAIDVLTNKYDTVNIVKIDYIDATDRDQKWYDLPMDSNGVKRVTSEDNREVRAYKCVKGQIYFGFVGIFKIEYFGTPTKITKFVDTPMMTGISNLFDIAIVKYILAQEFPDRFKLYMDMYEDLASKADIRLRNVKRKNMKISVSRWR